MTRSEKHFDEFAEHTRLKHLILDKYLNAWARKLLLGVPGLAQIWFVDAFAGEGRDGQQNDGSPLIAAEIARGVNREMAEKFHKPGRLTVLAIERAADRYAVLRELLRPYQENSIAFAYHGSLDRVIDRFRSRVGDQPVLYFLDPFGVRGLAAELFPKLFSGPRNEVFLLFSGVGATRLHAVLHAEKRDLGSELQRRAPQRSLFSEVDAGKEEEIRASVERHAKALDVTKPAAAAILREVFGQDRFELLRGTPAANREGVYLSLFLELLAEAGARYVLPFPVRNERNREVYHLVYATQSPKGLRAMKAAMSASVQQSALPTAVRETITVRLRVSVAEIAMQIARHFAGRTVPWPDPDERPSTVWGYAMEETAIFPHQKGELLEELRAQFPVVSSRPLTFRFP